MKLILGLDLGVSSIGWAVVREAENANETSHIDGAGVRIVPLSIDEQKNFKEGKSITTNATEVCVGTCSDISCDVRIL